MLIGCSCGAVDQVGVVLGGEVRNKKMGCLSTAHLATVALFRCW
jgi:hypothetical protein